MKLISQHTIISILVKDQTEALHFYTEKLDCELHQDILFGPGLRLVTVAPKGQRKPEIALAKPDIALHGREQVEALMRRIGRGATWIFATENCREEYELLVARGVQFVQPPTKQLYGLEALFLDLYGNAFVLLEASPLGLVRLQRKYAWPAA